ncbi:MAG: T9SS type A sorting domain-containing protein [Draconibacterium sp.]|nr:T9SS type A sorting domain-containing protein [Draconibacterium sp.]
MKTQNLINSFFAVVFTCIGITAIAQPTWTVNPNLYDYSMTITGKMLVDGTASVDVNDMVAAFIGGECRGVTNVKYQSALQDYFVFLMVYSNNPTGTVSFKIYDASEDKEYSVGTSLSFAVNGIVGSVSSPHEFSALTKTYEAKILSFTIPDQEGSTSIANGNVSLTQKITGNLSNVVPVFTLSEGAKAYVNDVLQVSGSSEHNFNAAVRYKIVPQVGEPVLYWVTITKWVDKTTKILLSNASVTENIDSVMVGVLTAQSEVLGSSYAFSLAELSGTDNQLFYIDGDKLYVKSTLDFELNPKYKVNIKVANNAGISKQEIFDIDVINQNDPPTGISLSSLKISEGTALNALVARLSASDEDAGDLHSFTLKEGNGTNDEGNDYFAISGDSLILKEQISKLGKENFKILLAVTDSSGAGFQKEFTFQLTDINNPPQFTSTPVAFAIQNQVYVYQVITVDNEGDATTIGFEGLPGWLSYNENTKLLTGIPKNENVGDAQFEIKAGDGNKETVQTVLISVLNVNDPPEIGQIPGTQYFYTGKENSIVFPENMITDPDAGDKLTFLLSTENNSAVPEWLVFDPLTLSITGVPPGDERGVYNLKLTATDDSGAKEYLSFKLEVSFPTAIGDQNLNTLFRVYPNPFQSNLFFDIPDGKGEAAISISNIAGQVIKTFKLPTGQSKTVSLGTVEPGIYFVRMRQGNQEQVKKIIKE